MRDVPQLDERRRGGDPLAAASRDLIGKMLAQAIRDAKNGCEKSARWLLSPDARDWMGLVGIDPEHFFDKLQETLGGNKMSDLFSKRTVDRRTAAQQRRDRADAVRQQSEQLRAEAEAAHEERAGKVTGRVLDSGLFPQRAPSFASGFASHMGLLSDAMSGDAKAQAEYRILGETGQTGQKKERDTDVKTKDVKGTADLATRLKDALGDGIHKKQYVGPTSWEDLEAQREAEEQARTMEALLADFSRIVDSVVASPEVDDKPSAISAAANGLQSRFKRRNPAKGAAYTRQLKDKTRKVLVQKGLTW